MREWLPDDERAEIERRRPWSAAGLWVVGILMALPPALQLYELLR